VFSAVRMPRSAVGTSSLKQCRKAGVAKILGPRSPPGLREETDLHRLYEEPVRVVSDTLQLDAAGACPFSYLLKAKPDGYNDGLCRPCTPQVPAHHTTSRDSFFSIITIPTSI
jgi:hypothetical protein